MRTRIAWKLMRNGWTLPVKGASMRVVDETQVSFRDWIAMQQDLIAMQS
jgi:hypothetical protein